MLATDRVKLVPAAGKAVTRPGRDFRLEPVDSGFEEVCAFHHMTTAMRFFEDVLGPDVFTDRPFLPLEVRVQDRTVRTQVGAFFPGRASISLADGQFPLPAPATSASTNSPTASSTASPASTTSSPRRSPRASTRASPTMPRPQPSMTPASGTG